MNKTIESLMSYAINKANECKLQELEYKDNFMLSQYFNGKYEAYIDMHSLLSIQLDPKDKTEQP